MTQSGMNIGYRLKTGVLFEVQALHSFGKERKYEINKIEADSYFFHYYSFGYFCNWYFQY